MGQARAFIDLHHETEHTNYDGNDFQLIVDDGNGNPVWADGVHKGGDGSIDETTYGDFSTGVNGENSVNRQCVAVGNNSPFLGHTKREDILDASSGFLYGKAWLGWLLMDNTSGSVDPSYYVVDASNFNFYAAHWNLYSNKRYEYNEMLSGHLFCTSEGKPKTVTIDGTPYWGFGCSFTHSVRRLLFFEGYNYPSTPTDNLTNGDYNILSNFFEAHLFPIAGSDAGQDREIQIDPSSYQIAQYHAGSLDTVENLDSSVHVYIDAMFNNLAIPFYVCPKRNFGDDDNDITDIGASFLNV